MIGVKSLSSILKKSFIIVFLVITVMVESLPVFALESEVTSEQVSVNSVEFSNVDEMKPNEKQTIDITNEDGTQATIEIEKISETTGMFGIMSTSSTYKIKYTGITVNAHFYIKITDNKVESVYDAWILIIGGTYENDVLYKGTTYGKLKFKTVAGIFSTSCWLKATTTGRDNKVKVTWSM